MTGIRRCAISIHCRKPYAIEEPAWRAAIRESAKLAVPFCKEYEIIKALTPYKPTKYPLWMLDNLKHLDPTNYKVLDSHIESVRIGLFDTATMISRIYKRASEAQFTLLDVYPIEFQEQEVQGPCDYIRVIILADPQRNPLLRVDEFHYFLLVATFSVSKPEAFEARDIEKIELDFKVDTDHNIRSYFPTTECVGLSSDSRSLEIGLGAEANFETSGKFAPDKNASFGTKDQTKARASAKWAWKSSYLLVGNPVIASRSQNGVHWVFERIERTADSRDIHRVLPLAGNDIQLMFTLGVPKEESTVKTSVDFKVWCKGDSSDTQSMSLEIPLKP